jgi:Coatomer gamma subunit appendage platform subdomain
VTNTLPEQQLSKVIVKMVPQSADFKLEGQIAAPVLQYQVAGTTYVSVKYLSVYPSGMKAVGRVVR